MNFLLTYLPNKYFLPINFIALTLLNFIIFSYLWLSSGLVQRIRRLMRKAEKSTGETSDMFESHYKSAVLEAKLKLGGRCKGFFVQLFKLIISSLVCCFEVFVLLQSEPDKDEVIVFVGVLSAVFLIVLSRSAMQRAFMKA